MKNTKEKKKERSTKSKAANGKEQNGKQRKTQQQKKKKRKKSRYDFIFLVFGLERKDTAARSVDNRKRKKQHPQKTQPKERNMAPKRERDGEPKKPAVAWKLFAEEKKPSLTAEQKALPALELNKILKEQYAGLSDKKKKVCPRLF